SARPCRAQPGEARREKACEEGRKICQESQGQRACPPGEGSAEKKGTHQEGCGQEGCRQKGSTQEGGAEKGFEETGQEGQEAVASASGSMGIAFLSLTWSKQAGRLCA